ncbi:hypothetical protein ACJZ2D_007091 [Fusarium nematophilum]
MDSKYAVLPFLPETRLKQFAPPHDFAATLQEGDNGVPSSLMKWAEEGYTVVEITKTALARSDDATRWALEELRGCKTVDIRDVVGLVAYDPELWNRVAPQLHLFSQVVGAPVYGNLHDGQLTLALPGIDPTGRKLEIPFTAVVNIRRDRLYHEHILWDQGTVLAQLGLMPEYLPYPYALPDSTEEKSNKQQLEYRVPVSGLETAAKMRDKDAVESN